MTAVQDDVARRCRPIPLGLVGPALVISAAWSVHALRRNAEHFDSCLLLA